jgi:hypothetical protein
LSQNRKCSRADIEATDKLSILAPNPNYCSGYLKDDGTVPKKTVDHTNVSYVDKLTHMEGNLVNVANVMGMQALHQLNTSLHPDPMSMTFVIQLAEDINHDGGVERELKLVDKLISSSKSIQIQIFQNDNFGESEENEVDVEHLIISSSSSSSSHDETESIAGVTNHIIL